MITYTRLAIVALYSACAISLSNQPVQASGDWPSAAIKQKAEAAGITRYSVYRLIDHPNAIAHYCHYEYHSYALRQDLDNKLAGRLSEKQKAQLREQHELAQRALLADKNKILHTEGFEISLLADAGYWRHHCRARERNWQVITRNMAKRAGRSDAKAALNLVRNYYVESLYNRPSLFFDKRRFGSANCSWENYDGMRIVGCRLRSFSESTNYDLFVVGRNKANQLLIAPLTGKTMQHIANAGQVMRATDAEVGYLSIFASDQPNIAKIRSEFPR